MIAFMTTVEEERDMNVTDILISPGVNCCLVNKSVNSTSFGLFSTLYKLRFIFSQRQMETAMIPLTNDSSRRPFSEFFLPFFLVLEIFRKNDERVDIISVYIYSVYFALNENSLIRGYVAGSDTRGLDITQLHSVTI